MRTRVVAVVCLVLAGCAGPSTSDRDESLTCDVGGSGAFGNACIKASAPTPITAQPLSTAFQDLTGVVPNEQAYGVHLSLVNGSYEGSLAFGAPETGTYEIYLSSNPPFHVRDRGGAEVAPSCASSISSSECSYLRHVGTYNLTSGQLVRFDIGPTTVNYVRLYVMSRFTAPPTCTAGELTEETAACDTAAQGDTSLTATALSNFGNVPRIVLDTSYGVRLPSSFGGYSGAIDFVAPEDGVFELYLGTPNLPLRIIGQGTWIQPAEECTRYLPSTECAKLRRGTRMALRAGTFYRLEFGPSASSFVRVEMREASATTGGTIKLGPAMTYPAGSASSYVTIADLNGDGILDVVDSNPDDAGLNTIEIMRGDGTGAFTDVTTIPTGGPPAESVVSDFNHDGIADVAAIAWDGMGPLNEIYLQGTGNFMYTRSNWGNLTDYQTQLSGADFNEDGTLDLLAAWTDSQNPGSGLGGFIITGMPGFTTLQNEPAFGQSTQTAVAGDFNGDGHQDVIAGSSAASALKLYLGNGSGMVAFSTDIALPGGPIRQLAAFDLDRDGKSDIVALHFDDTVTIQFGQATGLSAPQLIQLSGFMIRGIAAGDFDHDGRLDLAIGSVSDFDGAVIDILLATPSGFQLAGSLATPTGVGWKMDVADVNGDGLDDLVAAGVSTIEVWLGTP